MKIQIGKDNKKELLPELKKACSICESPNDETAKVCGSCGEEFIVTAEKVLSGGNTGTEGDSVSITSTSPLNEEALSVPLPIHEGRSEVRIIGDRLGLPKTLSSEECVNEIDKICKWCDREIDEAEKKLDEYHNEMIMWNNQLVRAKALLRQTEVRPFEGVRK